MKWKAVTHITVLELGHSFNSSYWGHLHTVLVILERGFGPSGVLRPQEAIAAFQHRLDHRSETENEFDSRAAISGFIHVKTAQNPPKHFSAYSVLSGMQI